MSKQTLPDLVLNAAERAPDRPALIDASDGTTVPYGLLRRRMGQVAAGLAARGFRPGDVLALRGPNVPPWAGVALGAMRAGGAVTGIGPAVTEAEAARQVERTRARTVVHTAEAADLLGRTPPPDVALAPGDVALLPSSSGTTGPPKSVVLTHANLVAGTGQVRAGLRFTERDVVLGVAPFAHVMGFVGALAAPLAAGATVVTLPRFEPSALVAAIERHRVTVLVVPPPVAAALAGADGDLDSLELVVCGGAPLAPGLQRRLQARVPKAVVGQGYGMTETTLAIPIPDRDAGTPPGSAGRLAPGTELRVVDPATGRELPAGRPGELRVRGPQVTPGYLDDPQATAELFDAEGWLRTGDLGFVDAGGHVHVVDRLKELIKVNALQVAPATLEALLLTRPDVADAAVVARPDPRTGEVPVAVVVAHGRVDAEELRGWIAARVARHERPAAVVLADRIPRTPAGKILRRELRPLASR